MMNIQQIKDHIRYITNQKGEKTDVLIPLYLWETIIVQLYEMED